MTKFYSYINEKTMGKTMIGFGISNSNSLNVLIEYIQKNLENYKVPFEPIEKKHISVAMINELLKKDELVRTINTISTQSIEFNIKKIAILKGREWDFISLELKPNDIFLKIYETIKEKYNIIEFPGGIRPHISLIKIQKGIATEDFMWDVFKNAPNINKIKTTQAELWNNRFQIDYSKKIG